MSANSFVFTAVNNDTYFTALHSSLSILMHFSSLLVPLGFQHTIHLWAKPLYGPIS